MTDLGPIWRLLRKSRWGRGAVAILISVLFTLKAVFETHEKVLDKDVLRWAGMGALMGLIAIVPLEYLAWRKKRKPDENLLLSGRESWLFIGYIVLALFIFAMAFL